METRKTIATVLAVGFVLGLLLGTTSANAAVVTDFSSFSESGNLLGGSHTREQSYTPSGADITIAHVSGGGAGQEFYLSSDFDTLIAGDRISVDLMSATTTTYEQFGLALTNSTTPGAVQVMWSWRHADDIQLSIRDGVDSSSDVVNLTAFPDTLFIDRTATGWSFGSITAAAETVHFADITVSPSNPNADILVDGSVLGFFSDMRSTTNPKTLSNLTVPGGEPEGDIPEPATMAMLGLAACGLGGYVRRRRRT